MFKCRLRVNSAADPELSVIAKDFVCLRTSTLTPLFRISNYQAQQDRNHEMRSNRCHWETPDIPGDARWG